MAKTDIVKKITTELTKLCTRPLTEQTAITAKHKVEAILAMALVQEEIESFGDVTSSLIRYNYILVEATINNSSTRWELSKKVTAPENALNAYDRAMRGI